ncbi:S1 family peptidase, partial [Rhodococcus maanshanensis]
TVDATFSGRDGVTGSTTTQQLTITAAATTTKPKPPASDAILGGDVYNTKNDDDKPFICSFGFNGTDGSGHAVNITAGHCDLDPLEAGTLYASRAYERYGNDFNFLGTFDKSTVAGMDYGVIKIDDSVAKRFENNFVRAAPGSDPVPITGTADPVVGAPACKAGVRTGYTCGTITAINMRHTMKSITYKDAIFSNICSNTGDSGGPLITGTKALGITSGGSFAGQCNKPGLRTVSTPIKSILADNPGLKVRTN